MNEKKQVQKGFTLIELLVVIAIIGLLSSVVLLSLNSAREKARNARRVADARQIVGALELYYDSQTSSTYPVTAANVKTDLVSYLATWPTYPTPAGGTCGATDYVYTPTGSPVGSDYTLTFCLSQQTGGFTIGTHTASKSGLQ
jgi:prepilin-type N-terminal cleavage/methylation domain-containing protein